MSNALASRLETLEAGSRSVEPLVIIIRRGLALGKLGLPLVRVTTAGWCERAEFRPRTDEDEAAFLRRVRAVSGA